MKVAFYTLGCKANQFDEAMMRQELLNQGMEFVPFNSPADVYIINTCTVTARTDYQSRQIIRNAVKRSQESKVVVTGCYAQVSQNIIKAIPGVSMVIGNQEKGRIGEYIKALSGEKETLLNVGNILDTNSLNFTEVKSFGDRTRAFLKIQDGCNSRCSYCIVPFARGKNRSLEETIVTGQVKELVRRGYKEIVLTGIHLGVYGEDFCNKTDLASLLERLVLIEGDFRIRLSSVEPLEVSDKLIEIVATSEKICPHLHIPLQSGDDAVLKKMSRNYDTEFYMNLVKKLTEKIPKINIGIDVIAGFPSETEEQFQGTCEFLGNLPAGYFHVFPFSRRPGTPAASFSAQISASQIRERSRILRELGERRKNEFRSRFIGETMSLLVEEKNDKKRNLYKGFTENYIPVLFPGGEEFKNEILSVKLKRIEGSAVFGELDRQMPVLPDD